MKVIFFLIIVSLVIVMCSCEEKSMNVFSGTIEAMITNEPIENADIKIDLKKINSTGMVTSYENIGNVKTDAYGKFYFEYDAVQAISFRITFTKAGFHSKTIYLTPEDVVGNYLVNTQMPGESYISFRIINVSPVNESDFLRYRISNMSEGCDQCCNSDLQSFYNNVDTTVYCPIVANDSILIEFYTFSNGVANQFSQQVIGISTDTVNIIMRF